MSVHAKLMEARMRLQNTQLKKTGYNTYSDYHYFEMSDFLPAIQTIFSDLKLCGVVSCGLDLAKLTITDFEDGTSLEITSPFGSAKLKASHEVQNIGACVSYQRRYLWMTALEIVEHDLIDSSAGVDGKKERSKVQPNAEGEDIFNNAEPDQREFLDKQLSTIRDLLNADNPKGAAEHFYVVSKMDTEEQAAVWSQLAKAEQKLIRPFKQESVK